MIFYKISLTLLFAFAFLLSTFPVSAHVLKTDGLIGAVLHVDPDDDPIANQTTNFFFEFKDTSNKFDPKNCNCEVSIVEDGRQIYLDELFQNTTNPTLSDAVFSYTFSEKNIYHLQVTGKPKQSGDFQPFTLNYDIRVAKDANNQTQDATSSPNWLQNNLVFLIGGAVVVILLVIGISRR